MEELNGTESNGKGPLTIDELVAVLRKNRLEEGTGRHENGLLTIDEMASGLKVKKSWLYRKTMETGPGSIPRIRLGKYLRFDPVAVMKWIESCQE